MEDWSVIAHALTPKLATDYDGGNDCEVLKTGECLMILYHDMNQKAKPAALRLRSGQAWEPALLGIRDLTETI